MTAGPAGVAGWYDDETDAALLRYWDGRRWTPHTAAKPHEPRGTADLFDLFADSAMPKHTVLEHTDMPEHTTVFEHTSVLEQTTEPLAPAPDARRTPRRPWRVGWRR
ncbi:hypothetical protein J2X63_002187 [Agromyces sp. 3263]|uniref:DUF2510 domain-containing protein n=1 Tax=Agromyces sp. 3263 TaxID=2817750 RepID=UPI0028632F98|nr:DUF2510 domain-containing protein [Agromyces sp. 3263]MDR6906501.1 hypothetical protein [Agromyces sp. 3263]